ncbi:MAG: cold shock domain-containing protein [Roseiflexaceae bacterium]
MSRKQREREREQQRKERKRERAETTKARGGAPTQDEAAEAADAETANAVIAQVAAEIVDQLGETEAEPVEMIARAVRYLGAETALAWLQETLEIEAQGGMWLRDGSRRRTPGGVFFKLLNDRIAKTHRLSIFYPEYEQVFPLAEAELTTRLAGVEQWPLAAAQQATFALVGRPAAIPPPDIPPETPYVVFDLAIPAEQAPAFTKGLPPVTATTSYRVLAPTQQWPPVAAELIERPDAQLMVIGFPAVDSRAPDRITVYASNIWIEGTHGPPRAGKRGPAAAPPEVVTGAVKWFSAEKGFGFITTDDRGDVFVHQSVLAEGRALLSPGERVYFGVREGRKGPEATDVRAGAPPAAPGPALPTQRLSASALPARIRLKLIGRPPEFVYLGRPEQPPSLIGYRIEATAPRLPQGLPVPAGPTTFLVLISLKNWKPVRDVLGADADDLLVVHGYPARDPRAPGMILVRATIVDTAAQLQERYEAHRAANEARAAALAAAQTAQESRDEDPGLSVSEAEPAAQADEERMIAEGQ